MIWRHISLLWKCDPCSDFFPKNTVKSGERTQISDALASSALISSTRDKNGIWPLPQKLSLWPDPQVNTTGTPSEVASYTSMVSTLQPCHQASQTVSCVPILSTSAISIFSNDGLACLLTLALSSISASDSSSQRSKSGAKNSGRFSCLVSLSHQWLTFFWTVMFTCLWVSLCTG